MHNSRTYNCTNLQASLLAACAALLVLWLRWDGGDLVAFISNSLWAEDGRIFVNGAAREGVQSIWTPYAGYLHLYPRLFALLAAQFDLIYTPWVFMSGFVLAVWTMMFVIIRGMVEMDLPPIAVFVAAILLGIQPNNGDIFFTLTNSQWFLAVALCVLVSVPRLYFKSSYYAIGGGLVSLTGPFSVLLVPVMLLRVYLDRGETKRFLFAGVMAICVVVQVLFIVSSGRGEAALSQNWREWLVVIFESMMFGGRDTHIIVLSCVLWGFFLWSMSVSLSHVSGGRNGTVFTILLLITAGGCMYVGGLWGFKSSPGGLNPVWGNARYFFSPYAMIVLAMLVATRLAPKTSSGVLILFALISILQFRTVSRPDLQFPSFAAFADAGKALVIPIAPNPAEFPGWSIIVKGESSPSEQLLATHLFEGAEVGQFIDLDNSRLSLNINNICNAEDHVGLTAKMWFREAGNVHMRRGSLTPPLSRFYPQGMRDVQFAFQQHGPWSAQLTFGFDLDAKDIHSVTVYCMPRWDERPS